jgi:L-lactate utilization protein LutB
MRCKDKLKLNTDNDGNDDDNDEDDDNEFTDASDREVHSVIFDHFRKSASKHGKFKTRVGLQELWKCCRCS